ncbi:type II secretion system protein [Marichromatium purpuratum]|nr:prepilin-type N-terminal cleavage/methylation domain-containing protein [Marichromatium purpuratum]
MNRPTTPPRRAAGFTLIELSIALIVIGMLISMAKVGGDLMRQSTYVKLINDFIFIGGWHNAYGSYTVGQGHVLLDDPASPTGLVNQDGDAVCREDLVSAMLAAGVSLPSGRGVGFETHYGYQDSNGNPQDMEVCFQALDWAVPDGAIGSYRKDTHNVMILTRVTPDLARMIDAQKDGLVDARFGCVREEQYADRDDITSSRSWSLDNNTVDEAQIATLTVHVSMDCN